MINTPQKPATGAPENIAVKLKSTTADMTAVVDATKFKLFVIVVENKGGVGKSKMAEISYFALSNGGQTVFVAETDSANKNMKLTLGAEFINLNAVEWKGHFEEIGVKVSQGEFAHAVIDCGARDETEVRAYLREFADFLDNLGVRLVVVRPLTLSTFVQNNAFRFVEKYKNDQIGVVAVRNLSQGRTEEFFKEWKGKDARATMLEKGVIEIAMEDAGPRWSDEALSFGLSFSDIAFGRFDKITDEAERAAATGVFTGPVQRFLAGWLRRQSTLFAEALQAAAQR